MNVGVVELLIVFVVAGLMVLPWIVALVDALRRPGSEWSRASQNQLLWVLVIVLAGIVGAILYFALARPALNRVRASGAAAVDPTSA